MPKQSNLLNHELKYLESLSAAVLQKTPKRSKLILYFWIVTIIIFIIWAYIAKVDEIVRSKGKVIPSGENKIVQNFEGGIVEDILAKEGDSVSKGDILLKIRNVKSKSDLAQYISKKDELTAKLKRLDVQVNLKPLEFSKIFESKHPNLSKRQKSLYRTSLLDLQAKKDTLKKQIIQKNDNLKEIKAKIRNLKKGYGFIKEEIKISKPMVKEGIKSKVDFLKLQREANNIKTELDSSINSIPAIKTSISEIRSKINELDLAFKTKSKKEYNDVAGELDRIKKKIVSFQDTVNRTSIKSPVGGIVKKLFVNTIGGVVKPGMDLAEIVPRDKNLIVEVKVRPKDIAFIYPGQKALIKFTAYNYSIYGGFKGKVIAISPDTITDKKNKTYYIIRIKTNKDRLTYNGNSLKIIPGMIVSADIITGKRTILDYILKPMLNSKDYIFTER